MSKKQKNRITCGFCRAYGNRTRDSSVKGMRLNPLTNAPFVFGSAKIGEFDIEPNFYPFIFLAAIFLLNTALNASSR